MTERTARATPARLVLHADMDAFYASIEQRDNPELRGKPVIVGASSARGVVAAASYEARKKGVKSAMPGFRARQLCPEGIFLPSDMRKYVAVSAEVHEIFAELTPIIEPIALDEAFLDITGSTRLFGTPAEIAQRLRARVREKTQLAVSCGIATNKLVAKIACRRAKPDGFLWVPQEQTRALLDPLPIRWLWGIGPVAARPLNDAGFATIGDIANAELKRLRAVVGEHAETLRELARGHDDRPVEADRDAKSYGEENTFERDVTARETVTAALTSHAQSVARRMRHDALQGRTITIKIKLGRARGSRVSRSADAEDEPSYPLLTRSKTLPQPTDDGAEIRRVAIQLWDTAGISEPVRLLGVSVSGLSPSARERQLGLFADAAEEKHKQLGPALDAIRKRFGEHAIHIATADPEKLTPSMRKKRGE